MGGAVLADCDVKLKPGDASKEIAEKLECLNNRIGELEKKVDGARGGAAASALPAGKPNAAVSGTPLLPSGCFAAEPGTSIKGTYIFEISSKTTKPLCWSDGSIVLTLYSIQDAVLLCRSAAGDEHLCYYGKAESFSLAGGQQLHLTPHRLIGSEGEAPRVKVIVETVPK